MAPGLRVLNRHRDLLGVKFRLDTVESKTQAFRDIVYVSVELKILRGIFLLLDELEKQDYSLSPTPVLRYLSAIRALIDALPTNLFLMMALTPEARRRYFTMLQQLQVGFRIYMPLLRWKRRASFLPIPKISTGSAEKSGDRTKWRTTEGQTFRYL